MDLPSFDFDIDPLLEECDGRIVEVDGNAAPDQIIEPSIDEPLLMLPPGPADFEGAPSTSHFNDWLHNTGPLLGEDAMDDHRYGPSTEEFDRLVNSTHDYYDKVNQMDLLEQPADHSYAWCLPLPCPGGGGGGGANAAPPVDDAEAEAAAAAIEKQLREEEDEVPLVLEEPIEEGDNAMLCLEPDPGSLEAFECQWRTGEDWDWTICGWMGTRWSMEEHVDNTHLPRGVHKPPCRWGDCGKRLAKRYLLLRHIRCVHSDVRPYVCPVCGERFSLIAGVKEHLRIVHEDVKEVAGEEGAGPSMGDRVKIYKCLDCDETFSTTSAKRHHFERKHTDISFMCEICNVLFSDRSSLARHRRRRNHNALPTGTPQRRQRWNKVTLERIDPE